MQLHIQSMLSNLNSFIITNYSNMFLQYITIHVGGRLSFIKNYNADKIYYRQSNLPFYTYSFDL